jgi:hypothetical protein
MADSVIVSSRESSSKFSSSREAIPPEFPVQAVPTNEGELVGALEGGNLIRDNRAAKQVS